MTLDDIVQQDTVQQLPLSVTHDLFALLASQTRHASTLHVAIEFSPDDLGSSERRAVGIETLKPEIFSEGEWPQLDRRCPTGEGRKREI